MKQPTTPPGASQLLQGGSLVTPRKTTELSFHVYPQTLSVKRPSTRKQQPPPPRSTTEIIGFSENSRRKLGFICDNIGDQITTQFVMSYGQYFPHDGKTGKRHLRYFLDEVKRLFPFTVYIWIQEFQTRGALHFHFYSNIPVTDDNRSTLASLWCNIVKSPDYENMLLVHDNPKNFIPWQINGHYLTKRYLDKAAQKCVPADFTNPGRFWGTSRNLLPTPDILTSADLAELLPETDPDTGEIHDTDPVKFLLRTVGRHHERNHRVSWFRNTSKSISSRNGSPIFRQVLAYLARSRSINLNPSPF